ncbi:hypothetical protein M2M59_06995 [Rummeliibacillus sp. G93]|nr:MULTISPECIES: hypothetical protein [Rummeliibacillus]MBB5169487.1 hypothetical protein [Rummeliibacillus stabekisii]MCM3316247.1 hypothetical protein [Rummeliibacillus stabekisii]UQW98754.1 hypothetical protein M2M59_06995 [Rummeliibacillus sp. G93]GEL03745.1 hypothetical protein RST01_03720 [Rummeliibacillus stabekisii]
MASFLFNLLVYCLIGKILLLILPKDVEEEATLLLKMVLALYSIQYFL